VRFTELAIAGAYLVSPTPSVDERGSFARVWDSAVFEAHGLAGRLAQCSVSTTCRRGTVRGLHYQLAPHEEAKLVRCVRGAVFEVLLDVRAEAAVYGRWIGVRLCADAGDMLYVPPGCAHGFQALEDGVEMLYLISGAYAPGAERGVRWNDPAFGIEWPITVTQVSPKDRAYPDHPFRTGGLPP
jgi:dTDP-4-dehydrorhamnose 3,5-epimerase